MPIMEFDCPRCQKRSAHEVDSTSAPTVAACLRCAAIAAEAAKLGPQPVTAPSAGTKRTVSSIVAMVAGGVMVLSAVLPWISIDNPFGGTVSRSGVEGDNRDGWILVGLGVIVLLSALFSYRSRGVRVVWALMGALGVLVAGLDIREVLERISFIDEDVRHLASVGVGLYAGCLGGAAAVLAALVKT
jgi:hypothetical protein